jgi:hypothetical protein
MEKKEYIKNIVAIISNLENTKEVYNGRRFFIEEVDGSKEFIKSIDKILEGLNLKLENL